MIKRLFVALFLILLAIFTVVKVVGRPHPFSPANIKGQLERAELRYFLDNSNPTTGLVRDNAENFGPTPDSNRMASISATGFGLAVLANASTRGLVTPELARTYTLKVLRFSRDHVTRHAGWFLHFVDWETGERYGQSEYSSIDTALFLAGALYAGQVLHDPEIDKINHQLYLDMDFNDLLTNGGRLPNKKTLSMAFTSENGYSANQWGMYGEQMLLLLMGLGHPTHPLPPDTWLAWERPVTVLPSGEKLTGFDSALFIHQYSQLFIDFRGFHDGFSNYWENGLLNTREQRDMMNDQADSSTFRAGFWGLSAGATPNNGYEAWSPKHHVGTVCVDCAIGSAMYLPQEVLTDASHWASGPFRDRIWGKYGFADSIDVDRDWVSTKVYGITIGPAFLSLANMETKTSLWKPFMSIPEIQAGLARAALAGQQARTVPPSVKDSRRPGSTDTP